MLTNLSSSSAEDISEEVATILERYGYARPEIFVGESDAMDDMMAGMRDVKGDLLISFGGDGTAAAVASIAREQGVPFLALPGGTMNVLMRGLYGSDVWQDCLMTGLAVSSPRPMTAGMIRDETGETGTFLVACMFGKPILLNKAREALRGGKIVGAARDALDTLKETEEASPLQFANVETESGIQPFEFLNVTCPFMDEDAQDPDVLNVSLFKAVTGGSAVSLAVSALLGDIRQNEDFERIRTKRFHISDDRPIDVLLDGEAKTFQREITVSLNPSHGLVMAPWPAAAFPSKQSHKSE